MEESSSFPPIDPTTFDLIIAGTGLTESIIAAAASAAGKTVLHLDPNSFYGSHFSSLTLPEILEYFDPPSAPNTKCSATDAASNDYNTVELSSTPLISDTEVITTTPDLDLCGRFSLDMSGPRILFCADSAVDLMIKTGISEYIDFKSIDASYVYEPRSANGNGLTRVPVSRSEIFKSPSLKMIEKTQLMAFFKLVQDHLESRTSTISGKGDGEGGETHPGAISRQDLESNFVEFLTKKRLPAKIKSIILYAIVMADYDQDRDGCQHLLKTEDAIERLALYHKSIVRFPDAASGMLYPMYGLGELPQAFCRRAAVKGCIYVLRMQVVGLLTDKDTGLYKGVKLASGQYIFSEKLIVDPSIVIPQSSSSNKLDDGHEQSEQLRVRKGKVAKGICILKRSVVAGTTNVLVVYPPRSLYPEQATSVRALQVGSNLAVCPSDMFVLYVSSPCDDASQGKMLLNAAIKALCTLPDEDCQETSSNSQQDDSSSLVQEGEEEGKPTVLWQALYIQEVVEASKTNESSKDSSGTIISAPSPDGALSYNSLIDAALKLFGESYPDAELFPESTTSSKDCEDDDVAPEELEKPQVDCEDDVVAPKKSQVDCEDDVVAPEKSQVDCEDDDVAPEKSQVDVVPGGEASSVSSQ